MKLLFNYLSKHLILYGTRKVTFRLCSMDNFTVTEMSVNKQRILRVIEKFSQTKQ